MDEERWAGRWQQRPEGGDNVGGLCAIGFTPCGNINHSVWCRHARGLKKCFDPACGVLHSVEAAHNVELVGPNRKILKLVKVEIDVRSSRSRKVQERLKGTQAPDIRTVRAGLLSGETSATPEIKILGSLLDPSAQGPRRESRLLCPLGMPPNPQPFGPISH